MISQILIHVDIKPRIDAINDLLEDAGLKQNHPDVLWIDDEKLGVEQTKKIRQFLSLKPYSAKGRAIVVINAHNFSIDAQNSLLKTLEEPPVESIILLGAESDKSFLPTVLSRCEVVTLQNRHSGKSMQPESSILEARASQDDSIELLIQASIEERFEFIEKLEEREQFLEDLIVYFHSQLVNHPSLITNQFAKDLIRAEEYKSANGNIRAVLEYLMLRLPK